MSQQGLSNIEASIITLLQEKNPLAITFIYQNYQKVLYGIILQIVGQEALAEDVLQEALVKMWRNSQSYDPKKGRLFTWMLRICRNAAIDKIRLKSHQQNIRMEQEAVGVSKEEAVTSFNPDIIGLQDLLNKLDEKHRVVIETVYLKEYTHIEAAEALGMPLGTLKTRVRNAMKQLQNLI